MTAFDDAFAAVIGEEGGYVDDPDDPGGETKYGISKAAYPALNIKNITLAQAKQIYHDNYWKNIQGDSIPAPVAEQVFDFAVNAGVGCATKLLQRVVGVPEDGVIGPRTVLAARNVNQKFFALHFAIERVLHYAGQSTFPKYGRGWVTRTLTTAINNLEGDSL